MPLDETVAPARRRFLLAAATTAGGLMVGCSPADSRRLVGEPGPREAGSRDADPQATGLALNAWVHIDAQGQITVNVPRAEMGQGIHTALAMLVAEELEADWARVQVRQPPPSRVYANTALLMNVLPLQPDDDGWVAHAARWTVQQASIALSLNVTGGSTGVRAGWEPMRWAGAAARRLLLRSAARAWGVDESQCRAQASAVVHEASGRRIGYGELVAQMQRDQRLLRPEDGQVDSQLKLKDRAQWRLIGTSPQRLDSAAKATGRAVFGTDIRLPGMRYATLVQCPWFDGHLLRVDDAAARAIAGVVDVIALRDTPTPAVAVVAQSTWAALRGARALKVEWDAGLQSGLSGEDLMGQLRQTLAEGDATRFRREGRGEEALKELPQKLSADYEVPYLAHAPMEPPNATALFQNGRLQLWSGSQAPVIARWRAAQIADLPIDAVSLEVPYLGGGFGRRLEVDFIEQVTHLALKMPGVPVQLLWTREEDLQHDMYRPAAVCRLQAGWREGADSAALEALHIRVCAPSVSDGTMRRILPKALSELMPLTPDKVQIEGAYDLPYAVPHQRVEQVLAHSPVPVGSWRSVGHSYNAFFTECFLDEVAQARGQDPLALRLALLQGPQRQRHRAVLVALGRHAGWDQPLPAGRARGLAFHESFGALCGQVAEVSLDGRGIRVHRITCVLDAGQLIHPETVKAQLESGIAFGLGAALRGRVAIEGGRVVDAALRDAPLLWPQEMPAVDCHLIDSREPPGGVGEPGTPPVAPAVANAVSRLLGRRIRRLPLLPELAATRPG